MNTTISRKIRYLLPILALIWTSAQAAELNVPNTFNGGSKAMASEVNANFTAVENSVNDNDARITELINTVSLLADRVQELEDALADIESGNQFVADLDSVVDVDTVNDTVTFSGVNVHVNSGAGSTSSAVNGLGNLIVGYDEARTMFSDKTGSHNLVVGPEHNYSSYGGLVAGFQNTVSGVGATVSGGSFNTASGENSSVTAGTNNIASGIVSSVTGGVGNDATGDQSTVSGGNENTASGLGSVVSGGAERQAIDTDDWTAGTLYEDL